VPLVALVDADIPLTAVVQNIEHNLFHKLSMFIDVYLLLNLTIFNFVLKVTSSKSWINKSYRIDCKQTNSFRKTIKFDLLYQLDLRNFKSEHFF
jgi:hypothetical protein